MLLLIRKCRNLPQGRNCFKLFYRTTTNVISKRQLAGIGLDLGGILRGTHGERRRWVGAECGGVW